MTHCPARATLERAPTGKKKKRRRKKVMKKEKENEKEGVLTLHPPEA